MKHKPIVIIRDMPIDVDLRMYESFAKLWQSPVTVLSETTLPAERIKCGYKDLSPYFKTIILDKENISLDSYIQKHSDSIYLMNGIYMAKKYRHLLKKYNITFGIVSERFYPVQSPTLFKILKRKIGIFYRKLNWRYELENLKFFLPMGLRGVECFNRDYGIPKEKLFNFIYCEGSDYQGVGDLIENRPVKMVYVGRFDYRYKGVDVLLDAVSNLKGKYTLNLVGGYGNDKEDILNRISKMPAVNYIGSWNNDEVAQKLHNYDVIVIPTIMDGYNLHCCLAITAGIAAIGTDTVGSDEVTVACGNGEIIPSGNVAKLTQSLQKIIDKPEIINSWKQKTAAYFDKISAPTVGKYLVEVLEYSILKIRKDKPKCPWLNENQIF